MMERLTKRLEDEQVVMDCIACENAGNDCHLYQCRNRLKDRIAAYEDTGLEPEQIRNAQETLACFDNIGIKRGNEIVKAEEEGRLVVLPCKVGDTVYRTWYVPGREPVITAHCMDEVEFIVKWMKHFGKIVFLTREEAERALEGRDDNG